MWSEYVAASGGGGGYTAWAFGSPTDPDQATRLGLLVRDGPKRATAGLLAEYEAAGDPLPNPGDHSIILDGGGEPLCVIRTTQVEVRPLGEVDDAFAWDEGEGNRTLEWWRNAHVRFFRREGWEVDDDSLMLLERFELVWPPPSAGEGGGH